MYNVISIYKNNIKNNVCQNAMFSLCIPQYIA